jgi:hypothetical protein
MANRRVTPTSRVASLTVSARSISTAGHNFRSVPERFGAQCVRAITDNGINLAGMEPTPTRFDKTRGYFELRARKFPPLRVLYTKTNLEVRMFSHMMVESDLREIDKVVVLSKFGVDFNWLRSIKPIEASLDIHRRLIETFVSPINHITTHYYDKKAHTSQRVDRYWESAFNPLAEIVAQVGPYGSIVKFMLIGASPLWPAVAERPKSTPWTSEEERIFAQNAIRRINPLGWFVNGSTKGAYSSVRPECASPGHENPDNLLEWRNRAPRLYRDISAHTKAELFARTASELKKYEGKRVWRYDDHFVPGLQGDHDA